MKTVLIYDLIVIYNGPCDTKLLFSSTKIMLLRKNKPSINLLLNEHDFLMIFNLL